MYYRVVEESFFGVSLSPELYRVTIPTGGKTKRIQGVPSACTVCMDCSVVKIKDQDMADMEQQLLGEHIPAFLRLEMLLLISSK